MKRIIAMILSLCLLLSAIPFAAAEKTEKSLHQLVWETFALENEAGEAAAFDEEAVAALVAKMIAGEELTEDELALQAAISPIGLSLLVSYTFNAPEEEQAAMLKVKLAQMKALLDGSSMAEISAEKTEKVLAKLEEICTATEITLVLTPVAEDAEEFHITMIDPKLNENEQAQTSILYCEVPAKKLASVPEVVAVIRAEQGEEAAAKLDAIANMTDEEAEEAIKEVVKAPVAVQTVQTEEIAEETAVEKPEVEIAPVPQTTKAPQNTKAPQQEETAVKYSYIIKEFYFDAVNGVITGGYAYKHVSEVQTTAERKLTITAPASRHEGYVFDENNEHNELSVSMTDPAKTYAFTVIYVKNTAAATPAPTEVPVVTPAPTAEPTVGPAVLSKDLSFGSLFWRYAKYDEYIAEGKAPLVKLQGFHYDDLLLSPDDVKVEIVCDHEDAVFEMVKNVDKNSVEVFVSGVEAPDRFEYTIVVTYIKENVYSDFNNYVFEFEALAENVSEVIWDDEELTETGSLGSLTEPKLIAVPKDATAYYFDQYPLDIYLPYIDAEPGSGWELHFVPVIDEGVYVSIDDMYTEPSGRTCIMVRPEEGKEGNMTLNYYLVHVNADGVQDYVRKAGSSKIAVKYRELSAAGDFNYVALVGEDGKAEIFSIYAVYAGDTQVDLADVSVSVTCEGESIAYTSAVEGEDKRLCVYATGVTETMEDALFEVNLTYKNGASRVLSDYISVIVSPYVDVMPYSYSVWGKETDVAEICGVLIDGEWVDYADCTFDITADVAGVTAKVNEDNTVIIADFSALTEDTEITFTVTATHTATGKKAVANFKVRYDSILEYTGLFETDENIELVLDNNGGNVWSVDMPKLAQKAIEAGWYFSAEADEDGVEVEIKDGKLTVTGIHAVGCPWVYLYLCNDENGTAHRITIYRFDVVLAPPQVNGLQQPDPNGYTVGIGREIEFALPTIPQADIDAGWSIVPAMEDYNAIMTVDTEENVIRFSSPEEGWYGISILLFGPDGDVYEELAFYEINVKLVPPTLTGLTEGWSGSAYPVLYGEPYTLPKPTLGSDGGPADGWHIELLNASSPSSFEITEDEDNYYIAALDGMGNTNCMYLVLVNGEEGDYIHYEVIAEYCFVTESDYLECDFNFKTVVEANEDPNEPVILGTISNFTFEGAPIGMDEISAYVEASYDESGATYTCEYDLADNAIVVYCTGAEADEYLYGIVNVCTNNGHMICEFFVIQVIGGETVTPSEAE